MKREDFSSVERTADWTDLLSQRVESSRQLCSLRDSFTRWKPKVRVSSFINQLHFCTFHWQKKLSKGKNVRFFDEFSWEKTIVVKWKTKEETNWWFIALLCRVQWREIRRSLMESGAELMLNGKSQWQIRSFYSKQFLNFIQAKHKSFDASIFNDNPMTKSLAEKSIEKTNVSSSKEGKDFFSSVEHFYSKRKRSKDLFISTYWDRWKNCWRKTVESILQIRCRWKINESKMKIKFSFRNLRHWNLFSSSSTIDFRQKIFKSKIKWKDFLQFTFSKFTRRTIKWTMFESKRFGRKSFFSLLFIEFIQNPTNLQLIEVLSPVNFSSNPTIQHRLKRDDWLFCLFALPRPLSFICKMSKSLIFIVNIHSIEFDLFLKSFHRRIFSLDEEKTMQRSLLTIRSFEINAQLNKFFFSSTWRRNKKTNWPKPTRLNFRFVFFSRSFTCKSLKGDFEKSTSSQSKSVFATIQRSDFHSFVQLYQTNLFSFKNKTIPFKLKI